MAKRVTKNPAAQRFHELKRRISKMQRRAKCNGLIYMAATLAFAAITVLALVSGQFWNPIVSLFGAEDLMTALKADANNVVIAVLNVILAIVMLVNVIKTFTKLEWLFKKKASKVHGFNRNMYAMDDMGKIFTSTFASIVWIRFLSALIAGGIALEPISYIVIAAGVAIHLLCGLWGGNISVFSNEHGVEEIKREIGNFVPFIRNVLQIALTAALMIFAMDHAATISGMVGALVNDPASATGDLGALLTLVGMFIILFMIGRSLKNVEFDPEGPEASGRGSFVFLSVLAFIAFAAAFALGADTLILAGISLAAIIIDALTVKYPREPEVNLDEVDSSLFFNRNYFDPGVYVMPNMVQHPIPQQRIQPYTSYGFELEYGMKKPAKLHRK